MHYDTGQEVDCRVLETQLASNPGDSGGPVVNDAGAVVRVNAAGDSHDGTVNISIELEELRDFLNETLDVPIIPEPATEVPESEGESRPLQRPSVGWVVAAVARAAFAAVAAALGYRAETLEIRDADERVPTDEAGRHETARASFLQTLG